MDLLGPTQGGRQALGRGRRARSPEPAQELGGKEGFTCPVLWQRLAVYSDGRVPMCHNDEFGSSVFADARTTPLAEIWRSSEMQRQREIQLAGRGVHENKACAECFLPRRTRRFEVILRDRILNRANRSSALRGLPL